MQYENLWKGHMTENAIGFLLRQAGYLVHPFGANHRCPTLQLLSRESYLTIAEQLRCAPDLAVQPLNGEGVQLEIKFFGEWTSEALRQRHCKLARQRRHYPQSYALFCRARAPGSDSPQIDDLVRILPPGGLALLSLAPQLSAATAGASDRPSADAALEPIWEALLPISQVFPLVASMNGWESPLLRLLPALSSAPAAS